MRHRKCNILLLTIGAAVLVIYFSPNQRKYAIQMAEKIRRENANVPTNQAVMNNSTDKAYTYSKTSKPVSNESELSGEPDIFYKRAEYIRSICDNQFGKSLKKCRKILTWMLLSV